jgi:DnaK suppressor protein
MPNPYRSERRLRPIRRAIERREADLRLRIAEERERADAEGFSQLAEHSGDEADHAFARIQIDVESRRIDAYLAEMRALAAARERMEVGVFGICVDCGEPIEAARLNASPSVARCAICQNRREYRRALEH